MVKDLGLDLEYKEGRRDMNFLKGRPSVVQAHTVLDVCTPSKIFETALMPSVCP